MCRKLLNVGCIINGKIIVQWNYTQIIVPCTLIELLYLSKTFVDKFMGHIGDTMTEVDGQQSTGCMYYYIEHMQYVTPLGLLSYFSHVLNVSMVLPFVV